MAILKLYAIKSPLKNKLLSRKKVVIITVIFAWIVPIAIATGISSNYDYIGTFFFIGIFLYYIIPYTITLLSYIVLCIYYIKHKKRQETLRAQPGNVQNQVRSNSTESLRFIKAISLILLGYTVTFVPFVVNYFKVNGSRTTQFNDLYSYSIDGGRFFYFTILYSNTLVDVFVYSVYDPIFRNFMKNIFIISIFSRFINMFRFTNNNSNDAEETHELQKIDD